MTTKPSSAQAATASTNQAESTDSSALDAQNAIPAAEAAVASSEKAAIPVFSFPFSPATFTPGKSDDQPWHQKGNTSGHHKTPSRAPNGSRRSMGKR